MTKLKPIAPGIWETTAQQKLPGGVVFPLRMTVIQRPEGLLLWSPIKIDEDLAKEISQHAPVATIAAPNKLHHLHLSAAKAQFPQAKTLAAPGLSEKRDDLVFDGLLEELSTDEDLVAIPIKGIPWMNETVLFHPPTSSLIITDLLFNIVQTKGFMNWFTFKVVAGTLGRLAQSRLVGRATKNKEAYLESISQLITLPVERIIPAHGDIVIDEAHDRLVTALG